MTAMEEYFPFVTKAYSVMQVTAWALLILIVVWQLFRAFDKLYKHGYMSKQDAYQWLGAYWAFQAGMPILAN